MGRKGRTMRSTSKGSSRSTKAKLTVPTPGLEKVLFHQSNDFKDLLGKIANYVASRDFTGACVVAVAMWKVECPTFQTPKQPTKRACSEYLEGLDTYFDKEDEYVARVRAWKENCVGIHTLLLKHCHPELRAILQTADGSFGFLLDKNDIVKLLNIVCLFMGYMEQLKEEENSKLDSTGHYDNLGGFENWSECRPGTYGRRGTYV